MNGSLDLPQDSHKPSTALRTFFNAIPWRKCKEISNISLTKTFVMCIGERLFFDLLSMSVL